MIPSVKDKIDFAPFVFPNHESGQCKVEIPYNLFCVFMLQGKQTILNEILDFVRDKKKKTYSRIIDIEELEKFIEVRLERN